MHLSDHFIWPVPSFHFILIVLFSGAIMPTQFFLLHVALTSISITTVDFSSSKSKGISSLTVFVHVAQRKEHRCTWGCLAQNFRMQMCCVGWWVCCRWLYLLFCKLSSVFSSALVLPVNSSQTQGALSESDDPETGRLTDDKPTSRHFYPVALLLVSSHLLVVWLILSLALLLAKYQ